VKKVKTTEYRRVDPGSYIVCHGLPAGIYRVVVTTDPDWAVFYRGRKKLWGCNLIFAQTWSQEVSRETYLDSLEELP